jgi:hypothetical protein
VRYRDIFAILSVFTTSKTMCEIAIFKRVPNEQTYVRNHDIFAIFKRVPNEYVKPMCEIVIFKRVPNE